MIKRCWDSDSKLFVEYHDLEWGVPVYDDRKLFEMLSLEGAQAGLSWLMILNKREGYRKAFMNFDIEKVAQLHEKDVEKLIQNKDIVRNRLKIEGTVTNARAVREIQKEFISFANYLWSFVDGKPVQNSFKNISDVPARTALSDKIAKDLKKRGFKFVGSTIIYAFMQAVGMVNDHLVDCFRYNEINKIIKRGKNE